MIEEKKILSEELIYEAAEESNQKLSSAFVELLAIKISDTFEYNSEINEFGLISSYSYDDEIDNLKKENQLLKDLLNKYKRSATYHQSYVESIRSGRSRRDSDFAGSRAIRELERSQ